MDAAIATKMAPRIRMPLIRAMEASELSGVRITSPPSIPSFGLITATCNRDCSRTGRLSSRVARQQRRQPPSLLDDQHAGRTSQPTAETRGSSPIQEERTLSLPCWPIAQNATRPTAPFDT